MNSKNEKSKDIERAVIIKEIKLKDIIVDPQILTRPIHLTRIHRLTELIALGDYPDSILVGKINKIYYLLDGNHRLEAWKIALGDEDAEIQARVLECSDFEQMVLEAFRANKKHGWPYTEKELGALYWKFTQELSFTNRRAREELGISSKHAEQWEEPEIVKIQQPDPAEEERAKPEEEPIGKERASLVEEPTVEERAMPFEEPRAMERATVIEEPIVDERANREEKPNLFERATITEEPRPPERATVVEEPIKYERAIPDEKVRPTPFPYINFHLNRLLKLIPEEWTEIIELFNELEKKIMEAYRD